MSITEGVMADRASKLQELGESIQQLGTGIIVLVLSLACLACIVAACFAFVSS
jgi:hypothetical protein